VPLDAVLCADGTIDLHARHYARGYSRSD
jgi:hypothetical protein